VFYIVCHWDQINCKHAFCSQYPVSFVTCFLVHIVNKHVEPSQRFIRQISLSQNRTSLLIFLSPRSNGTIKIVRVYGLNIALSSLILYSEVDQVVAGPYRSSFRCARRNQPTGVLLNTAKDHEEPQRTAKGGRSTVRLPSEDVDSVVLATTSCDKQKTALLRT